MPKRETPVTDVIQLAQKLVRFQSFGGQIEPVFETIINDVYNNSSL